MITPESPRSTSEPRWTADRDPCGIRDPKTGHPCGRSAQHGFDDDYGHVCRCQAERFLQAHAPCAKASA